MGAELSGRFLRDSSDSLKLFFSCAQIACHCKLLQRAGIFFSYLCLISHDGCTTKMLHIREETKNEYGEGCYHGKKNHS